MVYVEPCGYCGTKSKFNQFVPEAQVVMCYSCVEDFYNSYRLVYQCESCGKDFYKAKSNSPEMCRSCIDKEKDTLVCVDRAMNIYKGYHKTSDKEVRYARAKEWVRNKHGLSTADTTPTKIKEEAKHMGLDLYSALDKMAAFTLTEEAADEVITVSREHGLGLYQARWYDMQLKEHGLAGIYVQGFIEDHKDGILCRYEDDPHMRDELPPWVTDNVAE